MEFGTEMAKLAKVWGDISEWFYFISPHPVRQTIINNHKGRLYDQMM